MLFKIQVFDLMAQGVLELTLTDDEKSGIWNFADDYVRRINEILLALAWIESGDISDEGGTMGKAECPVCVGEWCGVNLCQVDTVVHYIEPVGRDAVAGQDRADESRRADEAIDLAIFPA